MYKILLVAFALTAYACAQSPPCPGCPVEQNANDAATLDKVKLALETTNAGEGVKKINKVTTQVVAGTKYVVEFDSDANRKCVISWVEQPWVSKTPQYVKFNCA